MKDFFRTGIPGLCAGTLNGLFGAGGGMVLVPLMSKLTDFKENQLFPASIAILFPVCIVSLLFTSGWETFAFRTAAPYLLGSALGGVFAGLWGKYVPAGWLHKILGILILWGGLRYLW